MTQSSKILTKEDLIDTLEQYKERYGAALLNQKNQYHLRFTLHQMLNNKQSSICNDLYENCKDILFEYEVIEIDWRFMKSSFTESVLDRLSASFDREEIDDLMDEWHERLFNYHCKRSDALFKDIFQNCYQNIYLDLNDNETTDYLFDFIKESIENELEYIRNQE